VLVVLGVLAAIKWSQISTLMAAGEEAQRQGPPPEAVGVTTLHEQVWESTLDATGTVASGRDVAIRTEVPGVVTRIGFESGGLARRGDVLVQLDARVERAELQAAVASERLARITAERTRGLVERGALAGAERDRADADRDAAIARAAGLRAVIARKTIRAPFDGRLGIREVNVGQYVEAGTTVTTIGGDDRIFVDFTLPQRHLHELREGMPVRIELGDEARSFTASLIAIEPSVHAGTRAIGLRAVVDDQAADLLRAGMFVDVHVVTAERPVVVAVPATAIVHAAYGDSVFLVEERAPDAPGMSETPDGRPIRIARQAFVRTGERRGDYVAILEGAPPGREVVSVGAFKLRNGSPIFVAPSEELRAELDPRPRDG
jgi:membrane fusion protein, multidrug efflux system